LTPSKLAVLVLGLPLFCAFVGACKDDVVQSPKPTGSAAPKGSAAAAAAPAGSTAAPADSAAPKIEFQEVEFAENERSRDPFRSYGSLFVEEARSRIKSQRRVLLDQYAIDELKLVGIVTRIQPAMAMLLDPSGKGHVVKRGQLIGRPEIVQAGASSRASFEINWRIDRIRDGDIVLVRDDPANPDVPSATKVIPLRPEGSIVASE
jgi:type IV pilus assembly protein PilP